MEPLPSAGKRTTDTTRAKTWNRFQARENMLLAPRAGKHAAGAKRWKTVVGFGSDVHADCRKIVQVVRGGRKCLDRSQMFLVF